MDKPVAIERNDIPAVEMLVNAAAILCASDSRLDTGGTDASDEKAKVRLARHVQWAVELVGMARMCVSTQQEVKS